MVTNRIVVLFSGGKDSIVTLDLCTRYFDRIYLVFMYLVPGLSFHKAMFKWVQAKYGLETIQLPHFMLSEWFRYGTLRTPDFDVPIVKTVEVYNYIREQTQCYWIAGGERIADSIVRRAMMKKSGLIDSNRGRIYPVGMWKKKEIMKYIKNKRLKISPEARILGHSFRSLMPGEMYLLKKYYPADYEKIQEWFPFVETSTKQYEFFHEHKN